MAEDVPNRTSKASGRKWASIGCIAVAIFIIALILIIIFFGMQAANPWGEQPGPGT